MSFGILQNFNHKRRKYIKQWKLCRLKSIYPPYQHFSHANTNIQAQTMYIHFNFFLFVDNFAIVCIHCECHSATCMIEFHNPSHHKSTHTVDRNCTIATTILLLEYISNELKSLQGSRNAIQNECERCCALCINICENLLKHRLWRRPEIALESMEINPIQWKIAQQTEKHTHIRLTDIVEGKHILKTT